MNIDERLERLADRHEALSHTVELLTHDIDSLRDALRVEGKETGEKIRALATIAEQNEVRAGRNENRMEQMMDAIRSLAHTVEAHEHRIADLEN
jgi:archaellum component FlaC